MKKAVLARRHGWTAVRRFDSHDQLNRAWHTRCASVRGGTAEQSD